LEVAANDVRDKVSRAQRQLPQNVDAPPVVTKADANADDILMLTVRSDTRNIMELNDYAENVLLDRLQSIESVSSVSVMGQQRYAMRLWIDPVKLAAYQLTFKDISSALNAQNVQLPAGKIYGKNTELTVNTIGLLQTEDDFNNLIVKSTSNQVLRFKDIGRAELGPENYQMALKNSGIQMIGLNIVPQPGSNEIAIADEFYKRFKQIKKELPDDIQIDVAMDKTKFIRNSVEEVKETLVISFALVILVIFLFFRDWLIAFRPLIDIPVSLIGTFFIMYLAGFSINVLTLLAIVLATGLVVDDGIVVTENIFKKIEKGMSKRKAAIEGANEIFFVVIATSITLAIVFLPIVFLQGFVGRLFREFGIVLAGAVLISAFVSLSLTPVLNVYMVSKGTGHGWLYRKTEPLFVSLDKSYRELLQKFMKKRWLALVIIAACAGLIAVLFKFIPSELAPLEDRSAVSMNATAPEGTSYNYMSNYGDRLSSFLVDSIPEQNGVIQITGRGGVNNVRTFVTLKNPSERHRSQQQICDMINQNLGQFKDARIFAVQQQTISVGSGSRSSLPVQFVLQNNDFAKLKEYLPKFYDEVSKSKIFQGLDVNLKFNQPQLQVTIDRVKAAQLGISVMDVSQALQLALSGSRMAYYIKDGQQYSVIAQVDLANRDRPLNLSAYFIRNAKGDLIQLDNLVTMKEITAPPALYHFNRYKSATVSAGLVPGKTIGDGIAEMQRIAKRTLDESFTTSLAGTSRDFAESSSNTTFSLMLALVLIFLVLAIQFESFIDPLIIMVTVPLAFAGALLSLWMFNQTLNIFSEIGIIMLIGLVTKNGILIVEFANSQRKAGLSKVEAVIEGAALRLRPILMTSLATAFGAMPIALALGSGSKSRVPLGITVVGGIVFSLILTLFVLPAIYTYLSRSKKQQDD
ncbi:MAG TPA: efflux RND transporter permease subunit, partial [Chitinispirillaceae bacterium]|nr:efflux RND transporter permease subunit [Chitinispirillaceae bacterium]